MVLDVGRFLSILPCAQNIHQVLSLCHNNYYPEETLSWKLSTVLIKPPYINKATNREIVEQMSLVRDRERAAVRFFYDSLRIHYMRAFFANIFIEKVEICEWCYVSKFFNKNTNFVSFKKMTNRLDYLKVFETRNFKVFSNSELFWAKFKRMWILIFQTIFLKKKW